jgi:hypothetical protein
MEACSLKTTGKLMATLEVDDVVQVIMTWDTPLASVAQNVWHLKMVSGAGADSDGVLPAVLTLLQVAIASIEDELSTAFEAVLLELRGWDFTLHRFDGLDTLAMTGVVGASISDYEPHGVAALGRIITEVARRQGSTFLPGLVETSVVAGVLVAAAETGLAGYLATFDTDISITGGLFSWCTFNVDPLSAVYETASLATQSVVANSLPSYLSKRKPGNGM